MFKTNLNDYRVLATNLLTSNNYSIKLSASALGFAQGEYVTDFRYEFGTVASGFASSVKPTLQVQVNGNVSNNYKIINRADVGGQYLKEWQTANTVWVTTVYRFSSSSFRVSSTLPRTNSLSCPLIISSFSCTIFSDIVCCLLSEWCVVTSFYQSLQAMSFFMRFSICASYCTLSRFENPTPLPKTGY